MKYNAKKIINMFFVVVFQLINVHLEMGYLMSEEQERKLVKINHKYVVTCPH